jgi:hypothetical protein
MVQTGWQWNIEADVLEWLQTEWSKEMLQSHHWRQCRQPVEFWETATADRTIWHLAFRRDFVQFCLERLWESSSISPVFKLYFQKQIQALCVIYVGHEFLLSYMLHRNDCALKRNDDWWSHSCIAGHHSSRFSMCTVVNCLCKSFCLNDSLYTIEIYSLDYLVKIINLWKLKHSFIY